MLLLPSLRGMASGTPHCDNHIYVGIIQMSSNSFFFTMQSCRSAFHHQVSVLTLLYLGESTRISVATCLTTSAVSSHFGSYPSLSLRTSISASSSHLLLVLLLVLSLLPRYMHHTTELVWPQYCKPFPSVSLASSCHTTLHCISSSFSIMHSLSV